MPATLQQNSDLECDLVRSRVVVSSAPGGVDVDAPVSEEDIVASAGQLCQVAFSADGLTGLAILDGHTWARSTADGIWVTDAVEDLFGAPDGQRATGLAWGSGNVCVMAGYYDPGTPEVWALYSSDGGATWTETASDLSAFDGSGYNPSVASNGSAGFVLLCADPGATYQFLAARSSDSGATWTVANGPAIGAVGGTAGAFYDAASGRYVALTPSGVSYSADGGATWSTLATLPGTGVTNGSVAVRSGDYVYIVGGEDLAGTPGPAAWRSDDMGTWEQLTLSGLSGLYILTSAVAVGDALVGGAARLGAGDALFHSSDGETWTAISGVIPAAPVIAAVSALGRGRIYMATTNVFGGGTAAHILSMEYTLVDGDPVYGDGNIQLDEGMTSADVLSLFTDRRASPDDAPSDDDLRGYWAAPYLGEDWGSLLWTLQGAPATPENFRKAEEFVKQALAWKVEDGIVKEIRATASYAENGWCRMLIEERSGAGPLTKWRTLWDGTINGL